MNPYERLAGDFARLLQRGKDLPLGRIAVRRDYPPSADASVALLFSPHPDDECIIGALPLRLRNEAGMRIINVAVTLGSRKERRAARRRELKGACAYLGFDLIIAGSSGLEKITAETRDRNKARWKNAVRIIAKIVAETHPRILFVPHEQDRHPAHIGTHLLVMDALAEMAAGFRCSIIETEFWRAMEMPNLMVESSVDDVGTLMAALSFHAGEVRRNPYHLRLPAWMQDNVRRGTELIGGPGAKAPDFPYATLYRLRRWSAGRFEEDRGNYATIRADG